MFSLQICQSLEHLNKSWTELTLLCLGTEPHPERRKTFCFAREALRLALCELNFKPEISDLVLVGFQSLKNFPELTISLSHSREVGVALVGHQKTYQSLGVDVEYSDRVVKDAIIQKVANPLDAKLSNIDLWVLKEAAFKCLMNSGKFSTPVLFTDIVVSAKNWSHPPSALAGECEIRQEQNLILGLAFLKN